MCGGNLGRDARTFSSSDALVQDGLWQTATHWWSVVEEGIVPHHIKSCSSTFQEAPFFCLSPPANLVWAGQLTRPQLNLAIAHRG